MHLAQMGIVLSDMGSPGGGGGACMRPFSPGSEAAVMQSQFLLQPAQQALLQQQQAHATLAASAAHAADVAAAHGEAESESGDST